MNCIAILLAIIRLISAVNHDVDGIGWISSVVVVQPFDQGIVLSQEFSVGRTC